MDFQRCCDVLDLTPPVTLADLKESYKDLVQVWHPDRFTHNPRLRDRAEEKIKLINLAYETLEQFLLDQEARQMARSGKAVAPPPFVWTVASTYHNVIHRTLRQGGWWIWFNGLSLENKARIYGILVVPAMFLGLLGMLWFASVLATYPMIVMLILGTIGFYLVLRTLSDASSR
jgi:DnaJ domain